MASGVYRIYCKRTRKSYVGQSVDIERRLQQHYNSLNSLSHRHHSEELQNDWDKYGQKAFIAEVVEQCPPRLLEEREKYWIDFYESDVKGYNVLGDYNKPIKDRIGEIIDELTELKERI